MKNRVVKYLTIICCSLLVLAGVAFATNTQKTTEQVYAAEEGVTDFVSRLYTEVLGREADENGLAEWTAFLQNGTMTGVEVASGFIMSEEFLGKDMEYEEFVRIMYSAFFGREANTDELRAWVAYLEQGYRKSFVFSGFANSTEFGNLCNSYGVTAGLYPVTITEQQPNLSDEVYNTWLFVERLYTEVLGRTPDMAGIKEWADYLQAGTYTGAEVSKGFIMSTEFQNKAMTNEKYVKIMYKAFFGREADQVGLEGWVNALETNYTKEFVFAGFANSAEFGTLCTKYGIVQGEVEMPEITPTPTPEPTPVITETPEEYFKWSIKEDGTVEITGLDGWREMEPIVVPVQIDGKTITSIGDYAFDFEGMSSITIPDTVTSIGEHAFECCKYLNDIKLPENLISIGDYAFSECLNLTNIELPESLTGIGAYAFYSCTDLTNIELPEKLTSISDSVFSGCTNLNTVKLPEGLNGIGNFAFVNCSSLENIDLPKGITEIGMEAFSGCSSLSSIVLPEDLTKIENKTFYLCKKLSGIELPENVISVGEFAFAGCYELTKLVINGNTNLDRYAFQSCSKLSDVTVYGESKIGSYCFENSKAEKRLTVSEASCQAFVKELSSSIVSLTLLEGPEKLADISCPILKELYIPASVILIPEKAIYSTKLEKIVVAEENEYYTSRAADGTECNAVIDKETDTLIVGSANTVLPKEVTTIASYAFNGTYIKEFVIPETVTLEDYAFYAVTIDKLTVPYEQVHKLNPGVKELVLTGDKEQLKDNKGIRLNWNSLTKVTFPEGITTLEGGIFEGATSLEEVIFPEGLTIIPEYAFLRCVSLQKVVIPKTVTAIGEGAFYDCKSLQEIILPEGITEIKRYTFESCWAMEKIVIPEGVRKIDSEAFIRCTALTGVELPASVTEIGENAFAGCNNLIFITAPADSYAATWAKENGYRVKKK